MVEGCRMWLLEVSAAASQPYLQNEKKLHKKLKKSVVWASESGWLQRPLLIVSAALTAAPIHFCPAYALCTCSASFPPFVEFRAGGESVQNSLIQVLSFVQIWTDFWRIITVMGPERNFLSLSGNLSKIFGTGTELFPKSKIWNGKATFCQFSFLSG